MTPIDHLYEESARSFLTMISFSYFTPNISLKPSNLTTHQTKSSLSQGFWAMEHIPCNLVYRVTRVYQTKFSKNQL